jgi:hypothetical protein
LVRLRLTALLLEAAASKRFRARLFTFSKVPLERKADLAVHMADQP